MVVLCSWVDGLDIRANVCYLSESESARMLELFKSKYPKELKMQMAASTLSESRKRHVFNVLSLSLSMSRFFADLFHKCG